MAAERPSERGRAAGGPGPAVWTSSLAPCSALASSLISLESASSSWPRHSLPNIKYSSRKTPNSNAAFRVSQALGMEAKNRQEVEELLTTGGGEGRRAERPPRAQARWRWGARVCLRGTDGVQRAVLKGVYAQDEPKTFLGSCPPSLPEAGPQATSMKNQRPSLISKPEQPGSACSRPAGRHGLR